jgi:transcriptional regulator with XRE-family HTH domain
MRRRSRTAVKRLCGRKRFPRKTARRKPGCFLIKYVVYLQHMRNIAMPFGEAVLSWRVFRGMTQEELAEKAGVPRSNLSGIERGRREVTLGTLRSLAAALDVKPGVLADGMGPDPTDGPLSRESLERIAKAVVEGRVLNDPGERALAGHLRDVVSPRLGSVMKRVPVRRGERAWLALRASQSKEVIDSLIQRVCEKAEAYESRAD